MRLTTSARRLVQRAGFDVTRFPGFDPTHMLVRLLHHHGVDLVVDVGANNGRYVGEIRRAGYQGAVISFEPVADAFARLDRRARLDANWTAHRVAIGDADGSSIIHIAANNGESSSLLPMLARHADAAPGATYVGQEEVRIRTLDAVVRETAPRTDRAFVKIDVQGYEQQVLRGGEKTLARSAGFQIELSFVPLYEGAPDYRDILAYATTRGFTLMSIIPGFTDPVSGQMLQADAVFMR